MIQKKQLSNQNNNQGIEWLCSEEPIDYSTALAMMAARVAEIKAGQGRELIWFLEHNDIYTMGTGGAIIPPSSSGAVGQIHPPSSSGAVGQIHPPSSSGAVGQIHPPSSSGAVGQIHQKTPSLSSHGSPSSSGAVGQIHPPSSSGAVGQIHGVPLLTTTRGGNITWHGRGQRVVYVLLDVRKRGGDLHLFITALLHWAARALAMVGVNTMQLPDKDKIGLWCAAPAPRVANKIVAIGLRVSSGGARHGTARQAGVMVSSHGFAINRNPDLTVFNHIVPCGIGDPCYGITSLWAEGCRVSAAELDEALRASVDNYLRG